MIAPLSETWSFSEPTRLVIGFFVGLGFGVALERAGLGSARKLIGQFHLTDFTVFKVMFSAILTAMLSGFWLGRLGLLDMSLVHVPETFLVPQLFGGLIFGAGFALCGLCPGTACVATATGRGDGAAVVAGLFLGVLVTGLALEGDFYASTPRGPSTLPALLGLPYGMIVFLIVVIAVSGFAMAERLERRSRV